MADSMTQQQLAEACTAELYKRDVAAQEMGIEVQESQPQRSVLTMKVRRDMLNGHNICHGGYIFALADTAFAYACNSANQSTVGQGASIEYLAPGRLDDTLVATAFARKSGGRTGIYDVEVCNSEGLQLALFRGNSYALKHPVLPTED